MKELTQKLLIQASIEQVCSKFTVHGDLCEHLSSHQSDILAYELNAVRRKYLSNRSRINGYRQLPKETPKHLVKIINCLDRAVKNKPILSKKVFEEYMKDINAVYEDYYDDLSCNKDSYMGRMAYGKFQAFCWCKRIFWPKLKRYENWHVKFREQVSYLDFRRSGFKRLFYA